MPPSRGFLYVSRAIVDLLFFLKRTVAIDNKDALNNVEGKDVVFADRGLPGILEFPVQVG